MESLVICLNAIIPIFLIIAVGYLAKRTGVIREGEVSRMNAVAFRVFMPAMCFYNVYNSDLSSAVHPRMLAFTAAGILFVFACCVLVARCFVPDPSRRGVVVQGLYRSNYLILGLALVSGLVGESALGTAAMTSALVAPLFNILAVIVLEANGRHSSPRKVVLDILKNPLILGSAAGLLALLLGLRLPAPLEIAVRDLSRSASPLMLFLLGAFFHFSDAKAHLRVLALVCLGRLVVIPGIILSLAALLGFRGGDFVTLLAVFASSTAVASFTMAEQMGGDAELAGNIVVMTSALASFTLFGWSLLFKLLGLY